MNIMTKMTDKEYRDAEGVSNSFLVEFDKSPKHALTPKKTTFSMELGTLLHSFILDDMLFYSKYFVLPKDLTDGKTKEYKDYIKEHPNKIAIKNKDYEEYLKIKYNVLNHRLSDSKTFEYFLSEGMSEIAVFWEQEVIGEIIQRKAKIDLLCEFDNINFIFELKSCANCLDFEYSVKKYKYYRQCASYIEGVNTFTGKETRFIFIAFETKEPYGVIARELNDDYIHYGLVKDTQSIMNYIKWKSEGSKPTLYKSGIETILKPNYLEG